MNCQLSISESEGTRIYPLQPFLLDASSLTLSPELSTVGRVKKQYPLHILITTESTKFDFGFVKVICISNLFSVLNTHGGEKTAHARC